MDKQQAWEAVLGELELSLSKANFTTWFRNTSLLDYDESKAAVAVPSGFHKDWLKNKYGKQIAEALKSVLGKELKLDFEVKSPSEIKEVKLEEQLADNSEEERGESLDFSSLNPKYTFDTFVIGGSNKLAQAACMGIARAPGKKYNPLFIYGGVGLGKTHLVQAIGNEIIKRFPKKKVLYTPSERFVNDFIESISSKKTNGFKNKYRGVDVLIIDDIQFLAGKESTQEEFFHTFNSLYQTNKQIVLSSDRPPQALNTLQERIKSRFEGGMTADIQPPDLETRMAILQEKSKLNNFSIPAESIEFISKSIRQNVRELEGALMRVMAYCELNNTEPSIITVKAALESVLEKAEKKSIKPKQIIETVAAFYDIRGKDILSSKRTKDIAVPRQITMFLLREELSQSFPQIAKTLGGKDHTTVMHGVNKIKRLIKEKGAVSHDIETLKDKLYNP